MEIYREEQRAKTGRLAVVVRKDDMLKTWKEYFEDLYNMDTGERICVCCFDGARRGYYFKGKRDSGTKL